MLQNHGLNVSPFFLYMKRFIFTTSIWRKKMPVLFTPECFLAHLSAKLHLFWKHSSRYASPPTTPPATELQLLLKWKWPMRKMAVAFMSGNECAKVDCSKRQFDAFLKAHVWSMLPVPARCVLHVGLMGTILCVRGNPTLIRARIIIFTPLIGKWRIDFNTSWWDTGVNEVFQ